MSSLVTTKDVTGFTFRSYTNQMKDQEEAELLLGLLHEYGPHYASQFGPDMRIRLLGDGSGNSADCGRGGIVGRHALCVDPYSESLRAEVVSHACIIYDDLRGDTTSAFGLFGAVITTERYRRRGLSSRLTQDVLADWDDSHPLGYLILGTGSPFAARVYQQNGFVHLAGGFENGKKGYNPEDLGEWIMIRPPPRLGSFEKSAFVSEFYNLESENENNFFVEPLCGRHWAELCLLFNLDESDSEKLPSANITDGLSVEEKVLSLVNTWSTNCINAPRVCCDNKNRRVHGIILSNKEYYVVPNSTSAVLSALLSARFD